ncbi:MAG: hypothetical protein ACREAK_04625 [Nitrosarchaeum sp.]
MIDALRIILLLLVAVVFVVIFANLSPQANMNNAVQTLHNSVTTVAYAGEFDEIRKAVDEFMVLRTIHGTEEGNILAAKLDERINNLQLVKTYCKQEISSMELVHQNNPYNKLQEICPTLKDVSFARAIQLFELI